MNRIARLNNTEAALQDLTVSPDGQSITWMRGQVSPEVWRVTFEHSSDSSNWTYLGDGSRITRGWHLAGLNLPFNQNLYVRARGYAAVGHLNSWESLFESSKMVYLIRTVNKDFDGDGKTDITVWKPGDGNWYIRNSATGTIAAQQWGAGALNDWPVPGDYDEDGKTDYGVWRPGDGMWYIIRSSDGGLTTTQWGTGLYLRKVIYRFPEIMTGMERPIWQSGGPGMGCGISCAPPMTE